MYIKWWSILSTGVIRQTCTYENTIFRKILPKKSSYRFPQTCSQIKLFTKFCLVLKWEKIRPTLELYIFLHLCRPIRPGPNVWEPSITAADLNLTPSYSSFHEAIGSRLGGRLVLAFTTSLLVGRHRKVQRISHQEALGSGFGLFRTYRPWSIPWQAVRSICEKNVIAHVRKDAEVTKCYYL